MSRGFLTRRGFLVEGGTALGASLLATACTDVNPLLGPAPWLSVVGAGAGACFDSVPNPADAGWTKDPAGNQNATPGTPLIIIDGSAAGGAFCNFFCSDAAMFASEILLAPRLSVDPGFIPDATDNNTGIHVSINDGTKLIRTVLLKSGPDQVRVALALPGTGQYSGGFAFPGLVADFTLRRLADGRAALGVSGQPEEIITADRLPISNRPGTQTLEFGTYDVPASSTTRWTTLGLPSVVEFPAGVTVRDMRIRDVDTSDRIRVRADFVLGPSSDGINPGAEGFSIRLSTPNPPVGQSPGFYSKTVNATDFETQGTMPRRRWTLTDPGRVNTGLEQFKILEEGNLVLVDRNTSVPTRDYSHVRADLAIGDDLLSGQASLLERPAGSGSWRLDR